MVRERDKDLFSVLFKAFHRRTPLHHRIGPPLAHSLPPPRRHPTLFRIQPFIAGLLGIPAYARHEDNPGLVKTYSEIVDAVVDTMGSETASPEGIAAAMRQIGGGRYQGYAFDSALDVLKKVHYAKEAGLKGIFFWEIGQDSFREDYIPGGALLAVAHWGAFDSKEETQGGDEL